MYSNIEEFIWEVFVKTLNRTDQETSIQFFFKSQADGCNLHRRNKSISCLERSVESKSDTIGIHIRSLSLIRIDTYRAFGAENMIASSPLSRWVSIRESEGGLMPPSGIHVAFPPSLYSPRSSLVFARAVLCLILLRPRSPFTKISRHLLEIALPELLFMILTLIAVDKTMLTYKSEALFMKVGAWQPSLFFGKILFNK